MLSEKEVKQVGVTIVYEKQSFRNAAALAKTLSRCIKCTEYVTALDGYILSQAIVRTLYISYESSESARYIYIDETIWFEVLGGSGDGGRQPARAERHEDGVHQGNVLYDLHC